MTFSLEHLGLPARNPVALKDWYVTTLDAQVVFDDGQNPPAFFLALPGSVMLEIYAGETSTPETANNRLCGWRHVALRVDSIDDARNLLTTRGVTFTEPVKPAGGGGAVLFFHDGEGNLLHLVERTGDSPLRASTP